MRTITTKYNGECRKCGADLEAGTVVAYEKRLGIFCTGCAPTDTEEIREYRQEAADRKAERYEDWSSKRVANAEAVFEKNKIFTDDYAFNTQPGHFPLRSRIIKQEDRACESLQVARRMQGKADRLRHRVSVKGDKEKARQMKRDIIRPSLKKGMLVHTGIYGEGVVLKVNKKTATIGKTGANGTLKVNVDISWLRILDTLPGI